VPLDPRRVRRLSAVVALVALSAFAVLGVGARTPLARGVVAGWIEDAAGLPTSIESLGLGFFPSPSVDIRGLAIAQPPGFGEAPLVTVGQLRIRIPWSGIFDATDVHEIAATDASVRLILNPDGAPNWSRLGGESTPGADAPAESATGWRIGTLELERGTIDYRDLAAGTQGQLTGIALDASELEPDRAFPFDLKLGGISGANTFHFAMQGQGRFDTASGRYEGTTLEYRGWVGGEPLPLAGAELTGSLGRASYADTTGVVAFEGGRFKFAEVPGTFKGSVDIGEPLQATLAVNTEPFAPRKTAIILGKPLPATSDPAAFESLQLALVVAMQDDLLRLDPVTGRLDDTNFEARVVPADRFVRAGLDRIDLNRYLPAPAKATTAPTQKATLESLVAELSKFDLDAEIRIEEARVAGATLRDAVIRVERGGETVP
jgi:AsmA protein